jgi:putative endonuclease
LRRPKASRRHLKENSDPEQAAARAARARALGQRAEAAVVAHLKREGASIVATNLHVGRLEIDIVAREGPVILVVEVRTRGPRAWSRGFGSLAGEKRARIRRAAERLWQRRYKNDPSAERLRIDAASVTFTEDGEAIVEYVKAAF